MIFKDYPLSNAGRTLLGGIPDGVDALALAELVSMTGSTGGGPHLHVASDDRQLEQLRGVLSVIVPEMEIIPFPAWDCLPYDRVSPNADVLGDRMHALMRLKAGIEGPTLVLTTVNAVLQRVPPRDAVGGTALSLKPGVRVALDELATYLEARGFGRTGTVREPGEYAFRGGIVDIFPPASDRPVRLDLFGDEIEKLRYFDPATQRSEDECVEMALEPVSELTLDEAGVQRFREGYRALFGGGSGDPVYEAVSERQRVAGVEHWVALAVRADGNAV